jgi:hypothetical protein
MTLLSGRERRQRDNGRQARMDTPSLPVLVAAVVAVAVLVSR